VAQLEITLARRRDSALAVAAGIRQARTAMEAASETLRLARREEDAARRMVETKTADWRAGVGDLRSVLDAVQSRTDSAIRAEAARHDLRIAHLRLLATAGRLARVFGVGDGEEIDMLSNEPYRVATTLLRENRVTINLDKAR
jgi:outer membrane protein TolC